MIDSDVKADDIFGKGPCDDAGGEERSVRTQPERRNRQQEDCDSANRTWLAAEFGVRFATLEELLKLLSG
jgi:hypothetical protein